MLQGRVFLKFPPLFLSNCTKVNRHVRSFTAGNTAVLSKPIGGGSLKGKTPMAGAQKKRLEVETDAHKLQKYLCGANIYVEGSDPEIKADSEYPDWLWTLRLERSSPPLEELDPDTYKYWRTLRKQEIKRKNLLQKTKFKYKEF